MKLPKLSELIDPHDVVVALLCLFVFAQVGGCEIKPRSTHSENSVRPLPPATQAPFKGGITC